MELHGPLYILFENVGKLQVFDGSLEHQRHVSFEVAIK
jgi:hypothetical protein